MKLSNAKKIVIQSCIIVSLGGLIYGLCIGVVNGSLRYITKEFHLSVINGELYASLLIVGCFFGSILAAWITRSIGRKKTIILSAFLFTVFILAGAFEENLIFIYICRFALGLGIGFVSFAIPIYLAEISPKEMRGKIMASFSLTTTLGVFLVYTSNYLISHYTHSWRIMLGVIAVPAIILMIGAIKIPLSPRWLILKKRDEEAKNILYKIRDSKELAEQEFKEIHISIHDVKNKGEWSLLKKPFFLKVLFLGVLLMALQQLTGINAIIFYSTTFLTEAGIKNAGLITVLIGLITLIFTIFALKFIDTWGRKRLLLIGLILMTVTLLIISCIFRINAPLAFSIKLLLIVSCLAYVSAFSFSVGAMTGIICAEILPLEGKDIGFAVMLSTAWIMATLVVQFSLSLGQVIGNSNLFLIFAVFCIIEILITIFYVPETKGVSLEIVEENLKNGYKLRHIGNE